MAVTRLKRKGRKNKLRAKVRAQKMKLEGFKPVIKQVDIDAVKDEFKAAPKKKPAKVAKEEPKVEQVEAVVEEKAAVKEEVAKKPKAPAKKKAAPKAQVEKEEAAEKPAKKKAAPKAKKEDKAE